MRAGPARGALRGAGGQVIWQLLKRDLAWKMLMPTAAAMFALAAATAPYFRGNAPLPYVRVGLATTLGFYSGFIIVLAWNARSAWARFEPGLPIAGCDIWSAGLIGLLAVIWGPAFAGWIFGFPASRLFEIAAGWSVVALALKCAWIRRLDVPRWARTVALGAFLLPLLILPFLVRQLSSIRWPAPPQPAAVMAVCGVACAALFAWGWTNVPVSLQVAPRELSLSVEKRPARGQPSPWPPVFHSIFGMPMIFLLGSLLLSIFQTGRIWIAGLVIGGAQTQIRGRCRWLLALPVSARALFGCATLPAAVTILAASAAVSAKHALTQRALLAGIAVEIAALYALVFLCELPPWRRLSKLRAARWGTSLLWVPFAVGSIAPILIDDDAFEWLARALPANMWRFAVLLVLAIIAMYWLAEKAFREQEYRQILTETANVNREDHK